MTLWDLFIIYQKKNELSNSDSFSLFKKKNSFKGKIGVFDIENNKINHKLNFYKVEDGNLQKFLIF